MNLYPTMMRPQDQRGRRTLGTPARLLILAMLVAGLIFSGSPAPVAAATTFTVSKTTDTADGKCNSDCSLREAIIAANKQAGWDTISLKAGTYRLSRAGKGENAAATGDLDITDDLTISGAAAATTIIDGNALDRVFEVLDIATLKVSNVTIQNGNLLPQHASGSIGCPNNDFLFLIEAGGGGILNCGDLTLTNSVVKGNRVDINGGGIYNTGTLNLINSTVTDNTTARTWDPDESDGGGIYNAGAGSVRIDNSTISGNSARLHGGGVANYGKDMKLTNSTVSGNRAGQSGGGLVNSGVNAFLILSNSTVAFNTADAVGLPEGGGGGISTFFDYQVGLQNSIVARNVDTSGQAPDCLGALDSFGYNIVSNTTGCTFENTTGDKLNVDPKLAALQSNGGPTKTHAPQAASPAIDAGNPAAPGQSRDPYACATADQRAVARPKDGNADGAARCDIGAVERQSATTP